MEDSRVGRFWSNDPLAAKYSWNSPYAFAENKVIQFMELEGKEIVDTKTMDVKPDIKTTPAATTGTNTKPPEDIKKVAAIDQQAQQLQLQEQAQKATATPIKSNGRSDLEILNNTNPGGNDPYITMSLYDPVVKSMSVAGVVAPVVDAAPALYWQAGTWWANGGAAVNTIKVLVGGGLGVATPSTLNLSTGDQLMDVSGQVLNLIQNAPDLYSQTTQTELDNSDTQQTQTQAQSQTTQQTQVETQNTSSGDNYNWSDTSSSQGNIVNPSASTTYDVKVNLPQTP